MQIGIIGSKGYLGETLFRNLSEKGHQIREIDYHHLDEIHHSSQQLDLLIDCGFPRNIRKKKISTHYLVQLEQRLLLSKQIGINYLYVGSLSEDVKSHSAYGRIKAYSADLVKKHGGSIVRSGLVVDNQKPGGRYQELLEIYKRMPIKIIPNESFFPLGITFLEDFLTTINEIVSKSHISEPEVFCKIQWITLKNLLQTLPKPIKMDLTFGMTKILCILINVLPLGKFDNLKSISKQITK